MKFQVEDLQSTPASAGDIRLSGDSPWLPDELPAVLEAVPMAVYACDAEGQLRWYNKNCLELWGRAPGFDDQEHRFAGGWKLRRLDGRPMPHSETPMAHALRTGEPVRDAEVVIERPGGSRIVVMVHVNPVRNSAGHLLGAINCFHEITEFKAAENRLRQSEARSRAILESFPAAVYTTDSDGRITHYNQAAVKLWGVEPELGRSRWCGSERLYHPDGRPMAHEECPMAQAIKENRPIVGAEALLERPDGTLVPFLAYPTPLLDTTGVPSGAVNMLVDISERKRFEEQQKVLIDELNHRVKNSLATVQGIVTQSLQSAPDQEAAHEGVLARLMALKHAHDLLTARSWEGVPLDQLLEGVLGPLSPAAERYDLEGPHVELVPKAALAICMAAHELTVNAIKHGALANDSGTVAVKWSIAEASGEPCLRLQWRESNGPAVSAPANRGFGSRLLERGLAAELRGKVEMSYGSAGVCCLIEAPLSRLGSVGA